MIFFRKITIAAVAFIWSMSAVLAQDAPLFKGSFEDCKKKAQEENKMIFVDLYFVGCMPCKMMDDQVFSNAAVIEEMRKDFILYKADVFKEADGMKIARKYAALGYPTFIILDQEGRALHTMSGYYGVNKFIPILKQAREILTNGQYLAFDTDLDKSYPAKYNYRYTKEGDKGTNEEVLQFLEGKDLSEEVPFVVSTTVNTPKVNTWWYNNLPTLITRFGADAVGNKAENILRNKAKEFGQSKQLDSLHIVLAYMKPAFSPRLWNAFLPEFVKEYYMQNKDAKAYLGLMEEYSLYPTWDLRSNALGQLIIDQKDDSKLLKALRKEYLSKAESGPLYFTDAYKLTLLHLYLGDYVKAKKDFDVLMTMDWKNPYHRLKQEDMDAFQKAIDKRDPKLFVARNIERVMAFSMDD